MQASGKYISWKRVPESCDLSSQLIGCSDAHKPITLQATGARAPDLDLAAGYDHGQLTDGEIK